jgi:hypothetical protein
VVRTKIFVGREAWEDFCLQTKLCRGAVRMAAIGGHASGAAPTYALESKIIEPDLVERVLCLERQVAELQLQFTATIMGTKL